MGTDRGQGIDSYREACPPLSSYSGLAPQAGKKIAERGMSVREAERLVDRQKQTPDQANERRALQFNKIPRITQQLSTHLGTQVRINIGKKKGKIEIEFDNIKDLERVVGKIIG